MPRHGFFYPLRIAEWSRQGDLEAARLRPFRASLGRNEARRSCVSGSAGVTMGSGSSADQETPGNEVRQYARICCTRPSGKGT
jgi:hypothetical protein